MRLEQTSWMEVRDKLKNPQGIIMALAYRNVDNFINNDEKEK